MNATNLGVGTLVLCAIAIFGIRFFEWLEEHVAR